MALSKFLDPKNDFCFKQIFGTEKNKDILIHFLNDVLQFEDGYKIVNVTFLKTNQDPEISALRKSIVDVLCEDQAGNQIIVEMQVGKHEGFEKRAQFYAARAYSQQVLKEDENYKGMAVYAKLKKVIFLAIADFIMFPEKTGYKSEHRILDTKSHENDLQDFSFVFFELPKFEKQIDELKNLEEKWMYFFKHAEDSTFAEIEHLIGNDMIIRRAFEAIDQASWDEEELRTYEHVTKIYWDNLAVEQYKLKEAAFKGLEQGIKQGIEQGRVEGLKEGKTIGIKKGVETGVQQSKVEIAKKMLSQGYSISDIAELTNLSSEEILKL